MNSATTPHTARAHATLAPSAAYRWINCPGSVKASEGVAEKSSRFAAEGTAAHELCNLCLETGIDASVHLGHFVDIDAADPAHRIRQSFPDGRGANGISIFEIDDEMVDGVTTYVDFVRGLMEATDGVGILDVEQRLDMRDIHPSIFGTGDAVVYDVTAEHLHVVDFKYGKGVLVSPEDNPQLFLYGAGAARRYHNHRLSKITLHVVQPRTQGEPIKSWETDLLDLFDFEGDIAKAAARTDEPDALIVVGEWCQFCPIRATCEVRRQKAFTDAQAEFDDVGDMTLPALSSLTAVQRGHILRNADQIFAFVKAVQLEEHANALAGNPPEGWKLVAKRANRKWKSEEKARELWPIYQDPKLLSPAQMEKAVGKAEFAEHEADLVIKQSSGVNLVPLEDPRAPVAADALAEFSAVD